MLRIHASAVLLVSLGLIAGCAEDTPSDPAASESTASSATQTSTSSEAAAAGGSPSEPCALLPADAVAEQFDIGDVTAETVPEQTSDDGAKIHVCQYTGAGTELGALTVSVHEGNQISPPAMMDALKSQYTASQDISGVGEAAVTFEDEDSRYLAAARVVSGTPVMVMFVGPKTATADEMTALVQPAIARLQV